MPAKENSILSRILCFICTTYILGISLCALLSPSIIVVTITVFVFATIALLVKLPHRSLIVLTCISFLIGTAQFYFVQQKSEVFCDRYVGRYVTVSGQIKRLSSTNSGKQSITLSANSISALGKTENRQLYFLLYTDYEKAFSVGEKITFSSIFKQPNKSSSHDFDFELYMHAKNISGSFFISSDKIQTSVGTPTLYDKLRLLSASLAKKVRENIGGEEGAVASAILLGDKSGFTDELTDIFTKSGISHIVAVSGMHLSILMAFFFLLAGKTRLHYKIRNIFGIVIVLLYMTLTGFTPSVTRAGIMLICTLFAAAIDRKEDIPTSFCMSAALILALNPYTIYSASFLLSYTALGGILIFSSPISGNLPRFIPGKINLIIAGSLSAIIFTFPVLAYMFNGISTLSLITNIIVIPLVSVIFISSLAAFLPGMAGVIFGLIPKVLIKIILLTARFVTKIPFSYISVKDPSLLTLLCFAVFVLFLYMFLTYRKIGKKGMLVFYATVLISLISFAIPRLTHSVTFFDIGQGDCALINTPCGKTCLVDTGPDGDVALATLRSAGINKIDIIFISHADADHSGALESIVKNFPTHKIVLPRYDIFGESVTKISEIATSAGADVEFADSFTTYNFDGIFAAILSPARNIIYFDENSGSLVINFIIKNHKFLFAGDIDSQTESVIINSRKYVDADVLKVSHHGSKDSSSEYFLNCVSADYSIISAGRDNHYGHPHDETLLRLNNSGTKILRTDLHGDIKFTIDLFGNMRVHYEADR